METKQMYSNVQKLGKFTWWLKLEMEKRNLTVTKLAQMSGVHPNTIRNYLAERCEPTLYNVDCIVIALGYELGVISV
jgi:transcriptional regulator with XRE-family HTH domain